MVGEEGEAVDVVMLLEAVQLHARVVVDVEAALLSHSKQHLIVQEPEAETESSQVAATRSPRQPTHCTSLTVSLTWNSAPSRLSFQSRVAT